MPYNEEYGDGEASHGEDMHKTSDGREYDANETAVLPKSICPDMKVGEEMVLKIVGVDEDSYQVSYAPEKGGDEEEGEDHKLAPEHDDSSMASMME
jgi:hypothetical protein